MKKKTLAFTKFLVTGKTIINLIRLNFIMANTSRGKGRPQPPGRKPQKRQLSSQTLKTVQELVNYYIGRNAQIQLFRGQNREIFQQNMRNLHSLKRSYEAGKIGEGHFLKLYKEAILKFERDVAIGGPKIPLSYIQKPGSLRRVADLEKIEGIEMIKSRKRETWEAIQGIVQQIETERKVHADFEAGKHVRPITFAMMCKFEEKNMEIVREKVIAALEAIQSKK